MPLRDYIIDHAEVNWQVVLRDWSWLLPPAFTVWVMNRYGDLFIITEDGAIHFFDVGGGTVTKIAQSRDDFLQKVDEGENANQWLMIPLIDRLVAAGMILGNGLCYSYKQPPVLGGDYTVENTCMTSIPEHYGFYGTLYKQIKDLPDGAPVKINRKDDEPGR